VQQLFGHAAATVAPRFVHRFDNFGWGMKMKKALLATLAAVALASGSAFAADLPARPVYKAPAAMAPAYNWTGCYLGGGGGYGMNNVDGTQLNAAGAFNNFEGTTGGRGWLGQVQGGCDYQFALGSLGNWVVGAFADYDWMDIHHDHIGFGNAGVGNLKENSAWSAGGRIGYLVSPTFLVYGSGGYTQTHFDQVNYNSIGGGGSINESLAAATYHGWFLGSGFEYAFTFLPIQGLFLKTEYRFSQYQSKNVNDIFTPTGAISGIETLHPYTQTITTELVYRFNWH
jgi:outer membrane immunogenic protein